MKKTLLFVVNNLNFLISHRKNIVFGAKNSGYNVKIAYGELGGCDEQLFHNNGIDCFKIYLKRRSLNPIDEILCFFSILKIYKRLRPDLVHLITIRPYLYGGIAARLLKIPSVIIAISGIGILYSEKNVMNWIFKKLIQPIFYFALRHHNQRIIVQNKSDKDFLINFLKIDNKNIILIQGSGVNLKEFIHLSENSNIITICFASRLLRTKGVFEYIEAAKIVKDRGINARFILAGSLDPGNPSSLKTKDLQKIINDKVVEYLEFQNDIPSLFAKSNIICLPSYYGEGFPKVLMEAAAASRVVITTDIPGCRDAIIPNKTGIIIPIKDSIKLAEAIQILIENHSMRVNMGIAGRKLAEKKYSKESITARQLKLYNELL